jgi:hypothetical protein
LAALLTINLCSTTPHKLPRVQSRLLMSPPIALTTISREVNLRELQIKVNLDQDSANVALHYDREINVPVIGKLFGDLSLRSSATMPRELVNSDN